MHTDDRIVDWAPRGQHIPFKCKKCGARFHTKNIGPLGCRNLFYYGAPGSEEYTKAEICDKEKHTLADLIPDKDIYKEKQEVSHV